MASLSSPWVLAAKEIRLAGFAFALLGFGLYSVGDLAIMYRIVVVCEQDAPAHVGLL